MDKLGLSAALGIQVLMQHTLVGVNGLLGKDLEPLPVSQHLAMSTLCLICMYRGLPYFVCTIVLRTIG